MRLYKWGCMDRAKIEARIKLSWDTIEYAYAALNGTLEDGVESATFDTGQWGARQHVKTLSPEELTSLIESHMRIIQVNEQMLCNQRSFNLTNRRR